LRQEHADQHDSGTIPVDAGEILFDGQPISKIRFGYVFQNYREALFPWLRAFDNIGYPLKLMGLTKLTARRGSSGSLPNLGVKIDLRPILSAVRDSSSWSRSCGR